MTSATTRTTPEQLYRLLADNATDVVTLHDLPGHYLYVSPSVHTLGGHEPEDILGAAAGGSATLTVNVSARQMTTPGFVEAIVGMTRALGIGVIPEGIETDGQPERLMAMGCDHAQGFLLSRPLPADELEGLL